MALADKTSIAASDIHWDNQLFYIPDDEVCSWHIGPRLLNQRKRDDRLGAWTREWTYRCVLLHRHGWGLCDALPAASGVQEQSLLRHSDILHADAV